MTLLYIYLNYSYKLVDVYIISVNGSFRMSQHITQEQTHWYTYAMVAQRYSKISTSAI